jgi:hypothetical protein
MGERDCHYCGWPEDMCHCDAADWKARTEAAESALAAIRDPNCKIRNREWFDEQLGEGLRIIHELREGKEAAEREVEELRERLTNSREALAGYIERHDEAVAKLAAVRGMCEACQIYDDDGVPVDRDPVDPSAILATLDGDKEKKDE